MLFMSKLYPIPRLTLLWLNTYPPWIMSPAKAVGRKEPLVPENVCVVVAPVVTDVEVYLKVKLTGLPGLRGNNAPKPTEKKV